MAKYHDLVKEHKDTIEYIKKLHEKYENLNEKFAELARYEKKYVPVPQYNFQYLEEADEVYRDMQVEIAELDQILQEEYRDVPFAKARQAGIDGFWRESGLQDLFE